MYASLPSGHKAHHYNIPVGLGTYVGAGTSLSLLQTMDEAYKVTQMRKAFTDKPNAVHSLTPMENLYLATLGGATVLSLQDKIGSFTAGKEADFVVLDPQAGQVLAGRNKEAKSIEDAAVWYGNVRGRSNCYTHVCDGNQNEVGFV